ncbi:MAG: hypothetical protein GY866_30385, partial [Proteobacteria bacterium]|nr:hypothetical protein [Pseudomonadota bacterium]
MRKNGNCRLFQTLLGVFSLVLVFGCTEKEEGSPTASTTTSWDTGTFIAQYESSGSRTWVQSFGTNGPLINAMATDSNENIAITGSSGSSTDFDPGSEVVNETGWASSDAFVSRYTSSGEFSWAETVGDTKIDAGKAVAFDTNGNVYYSGVLMAGGDIGTADFGSAGTKPIVGSIDMFVEKLASNGDETECLYYSGNGSNHISSTSMVTNGSSEVFITGYFNTTR